MTQKAPSKPPSKPPEIEAAEKKLDEACASVDEKAKKHEKAAAGLKKTISNPRLQAIKLPTPSQMELEAQAPPRQPSKP